MDIYKRVLVPRPELMDIRVVNLDDIFGKGLNIRGCAARTFATLMSTLKSL